jgi:very-short-patch-repair endonuclease
MKSDAERAFETYWTIVAGCDAPAPIYDSEFGHPTRRCRFDYQWPAEKVACEIDGGVWSAGRHTRGKGFEDDCEKINTAQALGWQVYRFTPGMLEADPETCIRLILIALAKRAPARESP